MTTTHCEKKIDGTTYRATIRAEVDGAYVSIQVRRDAPDGTFVWAELSVRQSKARERAKAAFAAEINAAISAAKATA